MGSDQSSAGAHTLVPGGRHYCTHPGGAHVSTTLRGTYRVKVWGRQEVTLACPLAECELAIVSVTNHRHAGQASWPLIGGGDAAAGGGGDGDKR